MRIQTLGSNPLIWGAACAALVSTSALTADITQAARELFQRQQNSLITVSSLSKMESSDNGSGVSMRIGTANGAHEACCNGLVLDASGLTVVSYTTLNPLERAIGAIRIQMGGENSDGNVKSELSHLQMRLADGTEVPARLVFKDKELDLAFLLPDPKEGDKAPSFSPVTLDTSVSAKELDDLIVLNRHGKAWGYQPTVNIGRITGIISKPRTMYDLSYDAYPGMCVFLADGRVLGIVAMTGSAGGDIKHLVLPAAEISKLADQARKAAAAKKDEKN